MKHFALVLTILCGVNCSVYAQLKGTNIFSYDNKKEILVDKNLIEPFEKADQLITKEEPRNSYRILELKRAGFSFTYTPFIDNLKKEGRKFNKIEVGIRINKRYGPTVSIEQKEPWQTLRPDLCWDGYGHDYIHTRLEKDIYAFIFLGKDYGYRPPQITVIVASSTTDIKVVLNRYYDVVSLINTDTNFSMKLKDKQGKELLLYREGDLLKLTGE